MSRNYIKRGFTLIELLIVIAIMGILSAVSTMVISNNIGKARDAQRRADLKSLQTALQAYYNDNHQYPTTGGAWSFEQTTGNPANPFPGAQTYIPLILSAGNNYIRKLPNDPNHKLNTTICPVGISGAYKYGGYGYISNGTDYKVIVWCTPEGKIDPNDALADPNRPYDWQVSSDGGYKGF